MVLLASSPSAVRKGRELWIALTVLDTTKQLFAAAIVPDASVCVLSEYTPGYA